VNFRQSFPNIKHILLVGILFINLPGIAQDQMGLIPQINADFKVGNDWKINSKLEGRQLFFQSPAPEDGNEWEYERTDLEFVATRSLDAVKAIGGGYLIRHTESKFVHRLIQQYSITHKLPASRLSHRFRLDQTFEKNESTSYRVRYRVSYEKPLNGLEIDPKEFYLKLNNEYLGSLQHAIGNLEIRALASIGYNLSDRNQIETGLDYRAEDLINTPITHKLFLNIGWYHSF
jgi:hypothetical protein